MNAPITPDPDDLSESAAGEEDPGAAMDVVAATPTKREATCPDCGGSGQRLGGVCPTCLGTGVMASTSQAQSQTLPTTRR